jgi:hypothetical protein
LEAESPNIMVLALVRTPWLHYFMIGDIMVRMNVRGDITLRDRKPEKERGGASFALLRTSHSHEN